ncbi:MAG: hypothetical protein ACK40K_01285 [Raineya sp.]
MASKKQLLEETKQVEEAIAEEFDSLQENIWRKIKVGLTIVFVGFGTYWVLKKYLDYPITYQEFKPDIQENEPKEESKIVSSGQESDIIQMIKKEIAVFLLAIAKQKIYELLQKLYDTPNIEPNEEDTK